MQLKNTADGIENIVAPRHFGRGEVAGAFGVWKGRTLGFRIFDVGFRMWDVGFGISDVDFSSNFSLFVSHYFLFSIKYSLKTIPSLAKTSFKNNRASGVPSLGENGAELPSVCGTKGPSFIS